MRPHFSKISDVPDFLVGDAVILGNSDFEDIFLARHFFMTQGRMSRIRLQELKRLFRSFFDVFGELLIEADECLGGLDVHQGSSFLKSSFKFFVFVTRPFLMSSLA